jgi:hypothetical protein
MASKRGDTRKKRKESRRTPPTTVLRSLRAGPLEMFQEGAYFGIRVDVEHPDYEAFRAMQLSVVETIPDHTWTLREIAALLD